MLKSGDRRTWLKLVCTAAIAAPLRAALQRGEPVPHFVAHTADGERLTPESLAGKVVLIEFWATWCKYCKADEPALRAITKDFASKGLVIMAVNMGEPKSRVRKYLKDSPKDYAKIVYAEDTTLGAICEARSYPYYVVINAEGKIAATQAGSGGEDSLRSMLAEAGLGGDREKDEQ